MKKLLFILIICIIAIHAIDDEITKTPVNLEDNSD